MLNGFKDKYQVEITDSLLESVHSVEFFTSICVIRKCSKQQNQLGKRLVAGKEAQIEDGVVALANRSMNVPWQENNATAKSELPPEEELPCRWIELQEREKYLLESRSEGEVLAKKLIKNRAEHEELKRELNQSRAEGERLNRVLSERPKRVDDLQSELVSW